MHSALALLQRQLAEKGVGELARLERETDKLSDLVQQLLLLAGLQAGRCPAETLAPVSMHSLCESIIEDANFEAAHRSCRVTESRQDVTLLHTLICCAARSTMSSGMRSAVHQQEVKSGSIVELMTTCNMRSRKFWIAVRGFRSPCCLISSCFLPHHPRTREQRRNGFGPGDCERSGTVTRWHHHRAEPKERRLAGHHHIAVENPNTRGRPAAHHDRGLIC